MKDTYLTSWWVPKARVPASATVVVIGNGELCNL